MPNSPLTVRVPLSTLQQEGAYLLRACGAHTTELSVRLADDFLATATAAHHGLFGALPPADGDNDGDDTTSVSGTTPRSRGAKSKPSARDAASAAESSVAAVARQANAAAQAGDLTREQNAALDDLTELMAGARSSARRAFKGQSVKLHDDYQVGEHDSRTLGDILQRAGIILASCRRDAAALKAKGGWTAADTNALEAARQATGGADAAQAEAQSAAVGATSGKNAQASAYFETLLTLQNAANLQWPESKPGNAAVRREFRLGIFPPRIPKKQQQAATTATDSAPSGPAGGAPTV